MPHQVFNQQRYLLLICLGRSAPIFRYPRARLWFLLHCPVLCVAVARGLESLEGQNLSWDRAELSQAWPLLGEPLDPKDKVLSPRLYEKLMAAGFTTHLQVGAEATRGTADTA